MVAMSSSMLLVGIVDDVGRFGRWRGNQGAFGASHTLFADVLLYYLYKKARKYSVGRYLKICGTRKSTKSTWLRGLTNHQSIKPAIWRNLARSGKMVEGARVLSLNSKHLLKLVHLRK